MSTTLNPFRSTATSGVNPYQMTRLRRRQPQNSNSSAVRGGDSVTLSAAATTTPRNGKKMAILGAIGTAVGIAAATVLFPAAGVGAMLISGLFGGVAGAAIGDGALKHAGTREPKPFDPFNPGHILDPDNMFHPRNPYNPLNFPK